MGAARFKRWQLRDRSARLRGAIPEFLWEETGMAGNMRSLKCVN